MKKEKNAQKLKKKRISRFFSNRSFIIILFSSVNLLCVKDRSVVILILYAYHQIIPYALWIRQKIIVVIYFWDWKRPVLASKPGLEIRPKICWPFAPVYRMIYDFLCILYRTPRLGPVLKKCSKNTFQKFKIPNFCIIWPPIKNVYFCIIGGVRLTNTNHF